MKKAIAIIPARHGSMRLPGKPLLLAAGKPLIRHVYDRAAACGAIDRVVVATDDERIYETVRAFGGEAVMTPVDCPSGTDRVAAAASRFRHPLVVNLQGDEPDIPARFLGYLVEMMRRGDEYVTLATPIRDGKSLTNPARVKVVLDAEGHALYFSRSSIPSGGRDHLLHIGLYGYTQRFLARFVRLPAGRLAEAERLEQLRALEHGLNIRVKVVRWTSTGGIDTMADYRQFRRRVERNRG